MGCGGFGRRAFLSSWLALALAWAAGVPGAEVYLEPEAFVARSFEGEPPAPKVIWLAGKLREQASEILGHPPNSLRVRYWARSGRSVWILEEIGKEKPITTGFVVENGAIRQVKVLIYRETRGWEVRHPFFTRQFKGAELTPRLTLDTHIDGVSGATLSVNALERLARLALLLHEKAIGNR